MIFLKKVQQMEARSKELETELSDSAATKHKARYQKLTRELASMRRVMELYKEFQKVDRELSEVRQTLSEEGLDEEMLLLCQEEEKNLSKIHAEVCDKIETELLRGSDPNAGRNVIIEIRAGTGGDEAALFAADLFRAYTKYANEHGLKFEILSASLTGKGGFKEVVFSVEGALAYSLYKFESGIHRVQRVPETESSGRIHTSAITVAVMVEAEEADLSINPADLKIDVFRASGAGGQHVNKTESAVRITHIPTGFVVSCQDERSQHKNKVRAMRVLRARLFDAIQAKQAAEQAKDRKAQVGTGDRSGKIRTYNFPDQRVTDHRIGLTLHSLDDILNGCFDPLVQALERDEKERRLTDAA